MPNFFQLFQSRETRYFSDVFTSRVTFKKKLQPQIHTSAKSLEAFLALEKELKPHLLENNDLAIGLARIINKTLDTYHKVNLIMGSENLESIALGLGESGISHFETIYRADEELLSNQFTHVTTQNLRELKFKIVSLIDIDKLTIKVDEKKKANCKKLLTQTQHLIMSAKTVSAVGASVAYSARIFTELGVAKKGTFSDSAICNLFEEAIPNVFAKQRLSLGTKLNTVGSAFQLEKVREKLIAKLEDYLSRRARLIDVVVGEKDDSGVITQRYQAIDRGFFYNKDMQEARVAIAATLLLQIQRYQLCDRQGTNSKCDPDRRSLNGSTMDTPQHFAQALMDAREDNFDCFAKKGRFVDQLGELYEILEEARQDMGRIYTQTVDVGGEDNLREQLGLEKPRQSIIAP